MHTSDLSDCEFIKKEEIVLINPRVIPTVA